MTEIVEFSTEVGPELLQAIGTGLIIVDAKWSGPSRVTTRIATERAKAIGVHRVFIVDHDCSSRLQAHFNNGQSKFHGWGEMLYISDGAVTAFSGHLTFGQIDSWLDAVTRG